MPNLSTRPDIRLNLRRQNEFREHGAEPRWDTFRGGSWKDLLLRVDRFGIEYSFSLDGKLLSGRVDLSKEAAAKSFVTGCAADLINFDQQRVAIAIEIDGVQLLNVAAFFALSPELFAAAAVVTDAACSQSFLVGFFVHPRHHQDIARSGILSNGRDQFILGKIGSSDFSHGKTATSSLQNRGRYQLFRRRSIDWAEQIHPDAQGVLIAAANRIRPQYRPGRAFSIRDTRRRLGRAEFLEIWPVYSFRERLSLPLQ